MKRYAAPSLSSLSSLKWWSAADKLNNARLQPPRNESIIRQGNYTAFRDALKRNIYLSPFANSASSYWFYARAYTHTHTYVYRQPVARSLFHRIDDTILWLLNETRKWDVRGSFHGIISRASNGMEVRFLTRQFRTYNIYIGTKEEFLFFFFFFCFRLLAIIFFS